MAISRMFIGVMMGVGAVRLLRKPTPPCAWMPAYSISTMLIRASAAVTFRSFVGGLMPNTPIRLEQAMYRATDIRYGTYRLPFSPSRPMKKSLMVVTTSSRMACRLLM